MLVGARRAVLGARPWYQGSFWRAGDGSRPQAIVDANRDRYAIPRLGANLIVNASWAMSTTGSGATATNSPSGQLNLTGNGGGNSAIGDQSIATTIGRRYLVVSTVASLVAAVLAGTTQGGTDNLFHLGHTGTMGHMFTATAATTWIRISRTAVGLSTVTNISVREVSDELAPGALSDCFTITRSGTATYVDSAGVRRTAAADVPRFDWSYGRRRLLVEPARANLFVYSEDFTQANWIKSNCTVTAAAGLDQTGAMGATKVVSTNAVANGHIRQNVAMTSGVYYTGTINITPSGFPWLYVFVSDGATTLDGWIDLATGASSSVAAGLTLTATPASFGAWKITATRVSGNTGTGNFRFYPAPSFGVTTGNGVDGMLVWGAQCEAHVYATSYIPTAGSTVTRAADLCELTPLLEAMAKSQVGTTVVRYYQQFDPDATGVARSIIYGGSDGGNTRENIRQAEAGAAVPNAIIGNGTSTSTYSPGAAVAAETSVGVALAKNASNSRAAVNGALIGGADGVAFDAAASTATRYRVGQNSSGTSLSSTMLDQFLHYKNRVSNAALPALSVAA
jgi:hypothetical protein